MGVLPRRGLHPKCGWACVAAFRRRTARPIAPSRCAPSVGAQSRALAAGVARGPAVYVPCARPPQRPLATCVRCRCIRCTRPAPAPAPRNPPPWACRAPCPAGAIGPGAARRAVLAAARCGARTVRKLLSTASSQAQVTHRGERQIRYEAFHNVHAAGIALREEIRRPPTSRHAPRRGSRANSSS